MHYYCMMHPKKYYTGVVVEKVDTSFSLKDQCNILMNSTSLSTSTNPPSVKVHQYYLHNIQKISIYHKYVS